MGVGNGNPPQYSCLENSVGRGTWWAAVCGVTQRWTRLKRLSTHACIGEGNGNPLQYSCWRIPGTEEPGGLPSMGSHRVGHDWSDLAAAAACLYIYTIYVKCVILLKWIPTTHTHTHAFLTCTNHTHLNKNSFRYRRPPFPPFVVKCLKIKDIIFISPLPVHFFNSIWLLSSLLNISDFS